MKRLIEQIKKDISTHEKEVRVSGQTLENLIKNIPENSYYISKTAHYIRVQQAKIEALDSLLSFAHSAEDV